MSGADVSEFARKLSVEEQLCTIHDFILFVYLFCLFVCFKKKYLYLKIVVFAVGQRSFTLMIDWRNGDARRLEASSFAGVKRRKMN